MRIAQAVLPVLAIILLACSPADSTADPVVADHMGDLFEAYLGRDLTRAELREITDELIRIWQQEDKSRTPRQRAARFDRHTRVLRNGQDGPAAQTARDILIRANYFRADLKGTLVLRLFLEPDPVRIVDTRSQRIMTERDVVALVNIYRFAQSSGRPEHQELSRAELQRATTELTRAVGGASGRMPQFYTEAAAFWSGVVQEWPALSTDDRKLVRTYATKTWRIKMPASLFGKLWGLDKNAAFSRYMEDRNERNFAFMEKQFESAYMPGLIDRLTR